MSQSDAQLFAVLARTAELRLLDFNVQEIANTAWAFATASQSDAQLLAVLARAAGLGLGNFNMQNLANTTWAFATFATAGESDVQLLASSGQVATLGQWEAVFAALAMAAERCVADFETQDIANMA